MQLFSILALFLGAVAAAPAAKTVEHIIEDRDANTPSKVKIHDIALLGSGCPAGSAEVQVDATGTLFSAIFSQYHVQTGPGTVATDWRKNCQLSINMEFDQGFQFSIMSTTMNGFAELPQGSKGLCKNTFSFVGNPSNKVNYEISLNGPFSDDFELHSNPGILSWSPTCQGSTAILAMNTQCRLTPTSLPALIEVDSITGKLKVVFAVQWRRCH